jgi:uncharacterized membrane protein
MTPQLPRRYQRHSEGLEFDRFVFFSDAVFAIAMTLLVVGIGVPRVADVEQALHGKSDEIISFFVSFLVIGYYWIGHHRLVAFVGSVETGALIINLAFLATIAFMPFPTALVGVYSGDKLAIVLYLATLAAASLLLTLLLARARQKDLLRVEMSAEYYHYWVAASVSPVIVFLLAIPVAYVDTSVALPFLIVIYPVQRILDRSLRPRDEDPRVA